LGFSGILKGTLKTLFLLFVFLLTASLSWSQDTSTDENSRNQIDIDSISNLNPYIEDHTEQLNIKMIVSNN